MDKILTIVGGGLAGCEAAWQAAERGIMVHLYEMRPGHATGAHKGADLAELICSNSLGSSLPDRATGLLQNELRLLGSLLISCADQCRLPAGGALAVGREEFSRLVTERVSKHPRIKVIRDEVMAVPSGPAVVSSGPLTSATLSEAVASLAGEGQLYFFDALAPIVRADTVDYTVAFRASRYDRGERQDGDYVNCPFDKEEYDSFVEALLGAERIELKAFEKAIDEGVKAGPGEYFEGCLPIEVMARRGHEALAFGPMRPVGLRDPRTGKRAHAILQLRQDDLADTLYNLVGFQTNLKQSEQERVFRLIPGLAKAEFVRYGQMHRNTYINSPKLLLPTLQWRGREDLFFAGQITGVEGYVGNIATGWLAGVNASRLIQGANLLVFPRETMIGALVNYMTGSNPLCFQPMKANFGIMPPLAEELRGRRERAAAYAKRSIAIIETIAATILLLTK